jgi:hypothetical protein
VFGCQAPEYKCTMEKRIGKCTDATYERQSCSRGTHDRSNMDREPHVIIQVRPTDYVVICMSKIWRQMSGVRWLLCFRLFRSFLPLDLFLVCVLSHFQEDTELSTPATKYEELAAATSQNKLSRAQN